MTHSRRGFALLTVLWVMVGASTLAAATMLSAREAVGAAHNRYDLEQGSWIAEGCLDLARASITQSLVGRRGLEMRTSPFDAARQSLENSALVKDCGGSVILEAAVTGININAATENQLRRFFRWKRLDSARVDSLVAGLLDWRDPDDLPRNKGAEVEWYQQARRPPPRNAAFASVLELRYVRGFEHADSLFQFFTVEPGKVAMRVAPLAVVASLPGVTDVLVAQLAQRRLWAEPLNQLSELGANLPPEAKAVLDAGFRELSAVATVEPEAWILTATARARHGAPAATIELRLVSAGFRVATMRRRTWP